MKGNGPRFPYVLALLFCFSALPASFAQEIGARKLPNHTPHFVATAKDLGPEAPSEQVTLHVWLQIRDTDSLKQLVAQLYDPAAPNYHAWLTREQFNTNFAPTAQEVETVQKFLSENNLSVGAVGERNLYVTARGSIADIQKAFQVQIHRYDVHGQTYRSNTADPVIVGPASALVSWVSGLTNYGLQTHNRRPVNPATGQPFAPIPLSLVPNGAFFSANCLRPPERVNFSDEGALPKATYFGNRYGADITNSTVGTWAPCGYQPSEIQTAYHLNDIYNAGLDGAGQTIVIVDPYGSPTIALDASTFSDFYGLAPLNLTVYEPEGPPTTTSVNAAAETTLDVEWAHAVAPGADIALVVALTDDAGDLAGAILYAVDSDLGNVISNSFGGPESELPGAFLSAVDDDILLPAAASGISVNFSTGDDGDFFAEEGYTDVAYPASSPYATAVGGTSLVLNTDNTKKFQMGWGNNATAIANVQNPDGTNSPFVPPISLGFLGGSGGGKSGVYAKPQFQNELRGKARMLPDVSYVGDPHTGVELICTDSSCFGGSTSYILVGVIGGTSLSCPMFSGIWAIANEKVGSPLGQAAQLLYRLPHGAIDDVVPVGSLSNVRGMIFSSEGTLFEPPFQLAQPVEPFTPFYSALYNSDESYWFVLTFETDSSLHTAFGWDDVTGLGTPNGLKFVEAVSQVH